MLARRLLIEDKEVKIVSIFFVGHYQQQILPYIRISDRSLYCKLASVDWLINVNNLHFFLSFLLEYVPSLVQGEHFFQIGDWCLFFMFCILVSTIEYLDGCLFSLLKLNFGEQVPVAVEFAYYFVWIINICQSFECVAINIEILFSFILYFFRSNTFKSSIASDDPQSPSIFTIFLNIMQDGDFLERALIDPIDILDHIHLKQLIGSQHI